MVRIKYRYLLGSIFYPDEFSQRDEVIPDVVNFHRPSPKGFTPMDLRRVVVSSILENFGEYGGAAATPGLQVKYFSPATSTFIIRVHREHFRLVWAAITLITRLPQPIRTPCVIQVIRNSGTIQLAEKEAIRRARDALRRAQCEGAEGSAQVLDFMVSEVQNSAGESDDEMDEG